MPHRAFIGIGSNLGDRKANYREASDRLGKLPGTRIVKESSLYESEPLGDAKTWFVNGVVELETEFGADELLKHLKSIEKVMGRKRVKGKRWGSRVIDLDMAAGRALGRTGGLVACRPRDVDSGSVAH